MFGVEKKSQLFQATVHAANMDDSVKMNHLEAMVTGKTKEAIAGLAYTAEMYNVAWNVLVRNFGKTAKCCQCSAEAILPLSTDETS